MGDSLVSTSMSSLHDRSLVETFFTNLEQHWTHYAKVACFQKCKSVAECICRRRFVHVEELKTWMKRSASDDSTRSSKATTNAAQLLEEIHEKSKKYRPVPFVLEPKTFLEGDGSCMLVFCVLLQLGRAELLEIFHSSGVYDHLMEVPLPDILRRTLKQKGIQDTDAIFQEFEKLKWEYLPRYLKLGMDSSYMGKNFIIPFSERRPVNEKGGTATVFHVTIKTAFVNDPGLREALKKSQVTDPKYGECYQMALKTYSKDMEHIYQWERGAFSGLNSDKNSPIVRFLGCYSHDEVMTGSVLTTYNLLLEYGQVDLEEYCADISNVPPVRSEEIIRFWTSMFRIGQAMNQVHNVSHTKGKHKKDYDGWHADIKPDNILSVHGQFKLADFGFAKFSEKADVGKPATNFIEGGTDTYGAPEVSRMRTSGTKTNVMQTIDTWSFGCVLSVAATWVVLGFQGILQYQALRQLSASNNVNGIVSDKFHDGNQVLPEVLEWHDFLREHARESDTATSLVLDLIESKMLLPEPSRRLDSRRLCQRLEKLIKEATREKNEKAQPPSEAVRRALWAIDKSAIDFPESRGTKKQPELLQNPIEIGVQEKNGAGRSVLYVTLDHPDRTAKRVGKGARLKSTPLAKTPYRREILEEEFEDSAFILDLKPSKIEHIAPLDTHQGAYAESPTSDATPEHMPRKSPRNRSRGDPNNRRHSPLRSDNDQPGYSSAIPSSSNGPPKLETPVPQNSKGKERADQSNNIIDRSNRQLPQITETKPTPKTTDTHFVALSGSAHDSPPSVTQIKNADVSTLNDSHYRPFQYTNDAADTHDARLGELDDWIVNPRQEMPFEQKVRGKLDVETYTDQKIPAIEVNGSNVVPTSPVPPIDHVYNLPWDICKVREDLEKRQQHHGLLKGFTQIFKRPEKDEFLQNHISKRDIIFVIDNGTSMIPHWPFVEFVAETLAMKLAGLDEDGIDVRYTISPDQLIQNNLRGAEGLKKLGAGLRRARPREPRVSNERNATDMSNTLERIFREYLGTYTQKKTTLIVLTDAVWEGTQPPEQLDKVVVDFVQEIQNSKRRFEARHFTIGFVRFGHGESEKEKLRKLDDELCKNYSLNDVIDACTWKVDVNKLILGSLDPFRDQIDEDRSSEDNDMTEHSGALGIQSGENAYSHLFESFNEGRLPKRLVRSEKSSTTSSLDIPRPSGPNRVDTNTSIQSESSKKRPLSFFKKNRGNP